MKKTVALFLPAIALAACAMFSLSSFRVFQQHHKDKKDAHQEVFTTLPSGIEFRIVKHGSGTKMAAIGDHLEMNMYVHVGDSVLFDSRKKYNKKPVPFKLQKPKFNGDAAEAFQMMVAGDSAVIRISVDSIKNPKQLTAWMQKGIGQKLEYNVTMVSVQTDEEAKKEEAEKEGHQKETDDKILQDYFIRNNIKATKTASGLYYVITKEGIGNMPQMRQSVTVEYTGKTLDGKTFDSNVDTTFKHPKPFSFKLGMHQVIPGWDEGVALMKIGGKATLYIPSALAYGVKGSRGKIAPNAILMFDVEVTDIQNSKPLPGKK